MFSMLVLHFSRTLDFDFLTLDQFILVSFDDSDDNFAEIIFYVTRSPDSSLCDPQRKKRDLPGM